MKNFGTISSKGQVTVPKEIRDRLGVRAGDRVEFVVNNGRTELRPAGHNGNSFVAQIGILGGFPGGMDEISAWIGEMRGDDEDPS